MGWQAYVPANLEELHERFQQLFENRSHIKNVKVDTAMKQIRIDLDWAANLKFPDIFIPVKHSRIVEARDVVHKLWTNIQAGIQPGKEDTERLYQVIDQSVR